MAPKSFLLACLLVFAVLQIFFWPPVSSSFLLSKYTSSMKDLIKLGEGCVVYPEDVSFGPNGVLCTATRDGWVKRYLKNGTWNNWQDLKSHSLLGITTTKENNVIVCDSENGLFKVSDDGVEVLDPDVRFSNDVIEASNGTLYFSVSSTKYTPSEYYKDLIEGKPYGQLRKYDPKTKQTSIVHEGFYFANGVALSKDEDFVVVCESFKFRCRRLWLKGPHRGKLEHFIDNLPGGPDNINLAPDGSFWIALIKMNHSGVEAIQSCREKEQLVDAYPEMKDLLMPVGKDAAARVVKVDTHGKIIREFSDPNATYISFVTSAFEYEDYLYMSSINSKFIGELPLGDPKLATI